MVCHKICDYTYSGNIIPSAEIAILFRGSLLLDQLFNQLLFLNEECPDDSILDTICTARTSISALYCLFILRKSGVFTRTKGWNL